MKKAPIILTKDKDKYLKLAVDYVKENISEGGEILVATGEGYAGSLSAAAGITAGYVLGGTGVLADETVVSVYALKDAGKIIVPTTE